MVTVSSASCLPVTSHSNSEKLSLWDIFKLFFYNENILLFVYKKWLRERRKAWFLNFDAIES